MRCKRSIRELKRGRTEVVDADLSKYFDTIPHAELMKSVARRIADKAVLHLMKMWLKVPIEEKDERGRPKFSGGKCSKRGTPQGGVISPLLANIYMNRLLRAFDKSELMKRCEARIVSYADDFVVVARRGATKVLAQMKRWLGGMKLTLNESKTSIRYAWKEHFRFLGYELGPVVYKKTGQRYPGARPSKKAVEHARREVSRILRRGRVAPWESIQRELNQFLRGWGTYFAYDSPMRAFHVLDMHVTERVGNFLRRRHKLTRATSLFKYNHVHRTLGVLELRALPRR
jgi:RNA-directed DNA polymerase